MTELSREEVLNVEKTDHPDLVGGIVWADCELNWIRSYGVRCHEAGAKSERAVSDRLLELIPSEEIGNLLAQAMNQAVANGANSVSMPDEYVLIALWLAEVEAMRKEKPE